MSPVRVALSGTPGTGKSAVAKVLARRGVAVVDVGAQAARLGAVRGRDRLRGSLEVDVRALDRALQRRGGEGHRGGSVVFEGHLAHFLTVDRALVLRCPPAVLARRLRKRGWSERKVRENACAEAVGVIVTEAVERMGASRVFELNTSGLAPAHGARAVERVAQGKGGSMRAGRIDFLEEAPAWC
jgi:adenylate kinase